MKTLNIKGKKIRSIVGKTMIGLVLASTISGISVVPAIGRNGFRPPERYDRPRYEHDRYRYERSRHVYRYYAPPPPVYAPPPVIYAPPPPPPGISIFFPPIIIR